MLVSAVESDNLAAVRSNDNVIVDLKKFRHNKPTSNKPTNNKMKRKATN